MELATFTTRRKVQALAKALPFARFYDTSTHAPYATDFNYVINASEFSPFIPYGNIPIPKKPGCLSDSVEGIWQGLKVIQEKIDESYFSGKGRKRYGKADGHLYGDKIIGYKEAREKIYIPSYEFMFYNCVPKEKIQDILEYARDDVKQFFFDVDDVSDPGDLSGPLAHSAVLVNLINNELFDNRAGRNAGKAFSARR